MVPSITTRQGKKRYRYYVCSKAQKRGWQTCPSKSIPAAEIERFVVDQIRTIGKDPGLIHETVTQVHRQIKSQLSDLEVERKSLERELALWNAEIRKLVPQVGASRPESPTVARLADLQFRVQGAERRATEVREQIASLNGKVINHGEVADALSAFDPIWEALSTQEQGRVIQLLVERVDYDGENGKVAVTFHPAGIKAFAEQFQAKGDEQ